MNYTEVTVPYTRIHEFKHYHPNRKFGSLTETDNAAQKTIIMREYPSAWKPGDEPYYPINNPESLALVARYQNEARNIPNLILGGRLGQYRYYDMDQAMVSALQVEI